KDEETTIDGAYHEWAQYALYGQGRPYRDSGALFITTLGRLGISRTRTYSYTSRSQLYECRRRRSRFSKNVKGYEKRYRCRKCRGKFSYAGELTLGSLCHLSTHRAGKRLNIVSGFFDAL